MRGHGGIQGHTRQQGQRKTFKHSLEFQDSQLIKMFFWDVFGIVIETLSCPFIRKSHNTLMLNNTWSPYFSTLNLIGPSRWSEVGVGLLAQLSMSNTDQVTTISTYSPK